MESFKPNPNKIYNFGTNFMNNDELNIVMVGKTGIGKSASGNTILGRLCFQSKCSAKSMTVNCSKCSGEVDGQQVAVIDTPGLFDTTFGQEKTTKDLGQCVLYAAPGPHIFLVVVAVGRFTEEEKQSVQLIIDIFGEAATKYSMVLFTRGDDLESTIEEYLSESPDLQDLLSRCNGQYHVFNNKLKDKKPQATELLQKIRDIVERNGGSHYTNEMFQKAERELEEKKQQILMEQEEKIRKEKEELERQIQEKYQKELKKIKELIQAERAREKKEREKERKREEEMNEERKREKEEMNEERKREKDMNEERKREMERREAERKEREREFETMKKQLQERQEREIRDEKSRLQSTHDAMARNQAVRQSSGPSCTLL